MARYDVVVVGAGHNGLVAACYLAKAGLKVIVLEQNEQPGGGTRTAERIPGFRFDLHSVAHNIINMTDIVQEFDLARVGLEYQEMNPFSVAIFADNRRIRFYRSVEATLDSIAAVSQVDAEAYAAFIKFAEPLVRTVQPIIAGEGNWLAYAKRFPDTLHLLRYGPFNLAREILSPYESTLQRWLPSDLTRAPLGVFAAHTSAGPQMPGSAFFAFWQAAYHIYGQWHAKGGSGALAEALIKRLQSFGGELRCNATVTKIKADNGKIRSVVFNVGKNPLDSEEIETKAVVTAMHPKVALLDLLDPPLSGRTAANIAATHTSNVVQCLLHVATNRLPPFPNSIPADYQGLQSYVDTLEIVTQGFAQAQAGYLPDVLPLYSFTTSALDDTLAPPGQHTIYISCPASPAKIRGGWEKHREIFVERCLDTIEQRAPGFRDSIIDLRAFTPLEMEQTEMWPNAHPIYLDVSLDQLSIFRPTRHFANHRTSVENLYISGAGTSPAGGVAGSPGKLAARALLNDWSKVKP